MKTLKLLLLWVGVMISNHAMAWCGGDGTSDCSAIQNEMGNPSSPYYQGGGGYYYEPIITPPPEMIMPDSWGAIAQSATTNAVGVASKQASKQASNLRYKIARLLKVLLIVKS